VHHQAEIADASSSLKYVFKRCDPFLRTKSVCPQKRLPPRIQAYIYASTDAWTKNKLVLAAAECRCEREEERKRERERERERERQEDSMRQKD
jgi:hypothetical protein